MNYKMSLKINPQYVDKLRTVALTLHPSFVSKHPHAGPNNVLIHTFTIRGIVFSIIHGDEMTVFCCAVQISMPRQYGETQIEITSETQMKYFTKNLSRRLPSLIWKLNEQMMFDENAKEKHLIEIGNDVDVVLLPRNLFMVMFDSTIYFFRIDFKYEVFCFQLPLLELNQTTYEDSTNPRIPNLSRCLNSFRFYRGLQECDNYVCFDVYSNVFDNSCIRASLTIHFDDNDDNDDTLERRVVCSRRLIERGVDDSLCSSTTEPAPEETRFSDKVLKIREGGSEEEDSEEEDSEEEDSEEEDSEEEDSDEEKVDPILVVDLNDGNTIYCFERLDNNDFFCIVFCKNVVYLLQVDRYDLGTLSSTDLEVLTIRFEIDSVDLSERLEEFEEVDLSCRIDIADPIQITCDFKDHFGNIVLTEQLIIENNELFIS